MLIVKRSLGRHSITHATQKKKRTHPHLFTLSPLEKIRLSFSIKKFYDIDPESVSKLDSVHNIVEYLILLLEYSITSTL